VHIAISVAVLVSALALPIQERLPVPKKSPKDAVTVIGCIKAGVLDDWENKRVYRLTGKKELIRELQKEHADHLDEVTGTLKSPSSSAGLSEPREKQFGKTRVKARVGGVSGDPKEADRVNAVPVITVTSFRHLGRVCSF
jgi:hypothetical protein